MINKKLFFISVFVILGALGIIVWYLFFATPQKIDSLSGTNNPLVREDSPPLFQFITRYFTGESETVSTTTTEIIRPEEQILTKIWDAPSTGQAFVGISVLREVTSTSTRGTTTITTTKMVRSSSTLLMFVDRASGNIYGHNVESGITYQITNTTIPGIYDAYIFNRGKRILMRYLDTDRKTIVSMVATIPQVIENGTPFPLENTTLLPKNISSVAVSSLVDKLSYLVPNPTGSSIYTMSSSQPSLFITSPFGGWGLFYGGEQLYAQSNPSSLAEGEVFSLPSFGRVVGGERGLEAISSPDGKFLTSSWLKNTLSTKTLNKGIIKTLSIKTLASKCSAGRSGAIVCAVPKIIPRGAEGLPDDWYQGSISFNDSLFLVDLSLGEVYPLYSFEDLPFEMDIEKMKVSSGGEFFIFNRKQDGSLWLFKSNLLY